MPVDTQKSPVHTVRNRNIAVAIWEQPSKVGKLFHTLELEHCFKDHEGNWQKKKISMLPDEALRAANILMKSCMDLYTLPKFGRNTPS